MGYEAAVYQEETWQTLIQEELKPIVSKIDIDHHYPESFLKKLGEYGWFQSTSLSSAEVSLREFRLTEDVSAVCMTTGFTLWCHLAAMTYLRHTSNEYLQSEVLPSLEDGTVLAGTGLSNPMKFYGDMERLLLKAERTDGGYSLSGTLPSVSNLGRGHWFGAVAETYDGRRIMVFTPCDTEGLELKEKVDYLGINGSATYRCKFRQAFIPDRWVISEDADSFVEEVRPYFLMYQLPLGLGVTRSSIDSMKRISRKQGGCNQYLPVQPEEIETEWEKLRGRVIQTITEGFTWESAVDQRLDVTYLTLKAANAGMLHNGGAGYLNVSAPARRLRETYFLVNLTPSVKHLEKMKRVWDKTNNSNQ
ncbi:acyl-CoA dehydrogenase family protein [Salimicrobium flavidum]|uniref:Acyl-CoA dehydrogenase/oxidase N-terminal domain-containing protein n=1 Tax=Salimicrobium flavidum TaxID=570947 RepID=A0A1N7IRC6_9BACI|nr:acyl-CoA dehydrogenase family protein [Salimicrobium flavidum]SIS39634.1 hypothetical protein SAMN05421687_10222 [Salimicrobium flavidum]